MENEVIEKVLENETEWRRYLNTRIDVLETQQAKIMSSITGLQVKYGTIAVLCGVLGSVLVAFVKLYFK